MRLHEFEAKELFAKYGLAVPRGELASSPAEAGQIAARLGGRAMIKAQVLAGGRGKAGGIRLATSPAQAERWAGELLNARIRGLSPQGVLVEEVLPIARELYVGIVVDGVAGCPAVAVSSQGGIEIEAVAAADPQRIAAIHVDPLAGLSAEQARQMVAKAGLPTSVADVLCALYALFSDCEALIAEINPLALLTDGSLVAADAVVEIDDAALFRHPEWSDRRTGRDRQGMTYLELEGGQIGLICSGAGLGMATMDLIADRAATEGIRPANFLETGGGITRELMARALRLVLGQPGLRAVLINIYGGINPIHEGALGIAEVMAEGVSVPVVAKALGNRQEETWEILRQAGVEVVEALETERAVEAVLGRLQEEKRE